MKNENSVDQQVSILKNELSEKKILVIKLIVIVLLLLFKELLDKDENEMFKDIMALLHSYF